MYGGNITMFTFKPKGDRSGGLVGAMAILQRGFFHKRKKVIL